MQKKEMKKFFSLFVLLGTLSSCGSGGTSSISTYIAKTLSEAIQNTHGDYQMDIEVDDDYSFTYQVISPSLYYYSPSSENYILLDEDSNYYHSFEKTELNSEEVYRFGMDVHGRAGRVEDKDALYSVDFLDILEEYADDFSKTDAKIYMCTVKDLAYDLKDYFQNRAFTYCNYFEIELGNDGRLAYFRSYEKALDENYLVGEVSFKKFDISTFEAYQLWNNEGRKINLRLIDLKLGSQVGEDYRLFYEDETCEVEGVVAGFDYNNNIIIATESELTGYIGLQVTLKNSNRLPSLNERIKVSGKVTQERYTGRLIDATYTSLGNEEYYPYFDEERIVDMYGGGYYAANIFSQTPVYADSVYSTYAYIESLPTKVEENQRATINLICPTFESEEGLVYHMQLILPSNMPLEEKESIVNDLKQYGIYNAENNEAEEVSFEHFIIRFNPFYTYRVQLEYGLESSISKHLSPNEKVESQFNLKGFPFPNTDSFSCFKFGGSSGLYIEANYGKEGKTQGIYYNVSSLTEDAIATQEKNLESYGFAFYNEIKDDYNRRHQIYKMGEVFVDILLEEVGFTESDKAFSMWIYQGEMIYKDNVQEKIAANIPYFNVDDFVMLDQINDADMSFYQLPSYVGNVYEEGNYLNCITLDVNEDCFATLRSSYMNDKGFKTVRDENNKIYTYNTRGSNHYILYKEIEGSDEKIYVDMAMYSTSDYTFSDHNLFTNRIEILIYKSTKPLETKYETNLNSFSNWLEAQNPGGSFDVNFKDEVKVESWYELEGGSKYDYIYYGYFYEYNAFIYSSNLNQTYDDIVEGLVAAGYEYGTKTEKGNVTYYKASSNGYASYVFIMKETDKGYIRLINGVGGVDF